MSFSRRRTGPRPLLEGLEHRVAQMYEGMSVPEIACALGVGIGAVKSALNRAGIVRRSRSEARRVFSQKELLKPGIGRVPLLFGEEQQIALMYESMSEQEIAERLGVGRCPVRSALRRAGVRKRTRGEAQSLAVRKGRKKLGGSRPGRVKSRFVDKRGYVWVKDGQGIWVQEHRLVAETLSGRRLDSNERVHHRDTVKGRNVPENLEVVTASEHADIHHGVDVDLVELRCLFAEGLSQCALAKHFGVSRWAIRRRLEMMGS